MEYQKIANLLSNESDQPSYLERETGLKQMMNQEEIMQMTTLNLRLQC